MEVHTRGWPQFLNREYVQKKLKPVMEELGISECEFTCDKPSQAKWANITFFHVNHAEAFLQRHGEEVTHIHTSNANAVASNLAKRKGRQRKARLVLMGSDIFCSKSKNSSHPNASPGEPDPFAIRGLKYTIQENLKPTRPIKVEKDPDVFDVTSLSCGHTAFVGGNLVYLPEVEFQDVGVAKFSKHHVIIKLRSLRVIKIPLSTVRELVCSFQHIFTLTLNQEPSFFEDLHATPLDSLDSLANMFRRMSISNREKMPRTRLCALDEDHAKVVGQCLVYQLQVTASDIEQTVGSLKNNAAIPFVRYNVFTLRTPPIHLQSSHSAMRALMTQLSEFNLGRHMPFGLLFQLHALASNAYFHPGLVLALAREIKKVLAADRIAEKRPISIYAIKKLMEESRYPHAHGDPTKLEIPAIVQYLREAEDSMARDEVYRGGILAPTQHLALVHRLIITPTRMTLHGPELEVKNRILRKFPNHHDFFVRVQFADEDGENLFFSPRISYEKVYNRFKHVLRSGVEIAGRRYEFLAFSHSSLRSHSVWFVAQFTDDKSNVQSHVSIIKSLGNFADIKSPARCAARIGQAFSETPYYVSLDDHNIVVEQVPDVKCQDRVFSDGVGKFSWQVLHSIWDTIPATWDTIPAIKARPTAFQIRFRGSKGMIALDSRLSGSVVCIRPSMTKFESNDEAILEICDMASKPIPLFLNRQMIKILEDMGCCHDWFFRVQNVELERIRAVTANAQNVTTFLKHENIGEGLRLPRLFRRLENLGIDYRKDRFLRSVVEAVVLRNLRVLKRKARIPIQKGITLFGIMDETGFLQEHEVYVTFDKMGDRFDNPPQSGQAIIVTRSPALHPGDIQVATNVIPPRGHPLLDNENVIYFSRNGSRDLPSQLSGGDLDGDIFNVIWDQDAMPKQTFAPADYPRVPPKELDRQVTRDDMADFFIDFMQSDHLGIIAMRHMILADQTPTGTLDDACLKLAQLHSTAVDFSKTGLKVNLGELPRTNRGRPDFLAPGPECRVVDKTTIELDYYISQPAYDEEEDQYSSPRLEYYESDHLLGWLYRAIDENKIWHEDVICKVQALPPAAFWQQFFVKVHAKYVAIVDDPRGWKRHLISAREVRGWYESSFLEAMSSFSGHPVNPLTELEVFIGDILNRSGVQTHRQRDRSIKLKDRFDHISTWITHHMRKVKHEPEGAQPTGYQTEFDNLHLCLAGVSVGFEPRSGQGGGRFKDLQSFAVVAACALLDELAVFEKRQQSRAGGGYVGGKDVPVFPAKSDVWADIHSVAIPPRSSYGLFH